MLALFNFQAGLGLRREKLDYHKTGDGYPNFDAINRGLQNSSLRHTKSIHLENTKCLIKLSRLKLAAE